MPNSGNLGTWSRLMMGTPPKSIGLDAKLPSLPFVMFIGMNFLHPGYGKALFEDPLGQKLVTYAGGAMVIGIVVIRKIVNVKY